MRHLTGEAFAAMVHNGYKDVKIEHEKINDLNVFPVPDGDTGTNITATLTGGMKAMEKADQSSISSVANALAKGMLLGARGNSGVILSQFFSGMADGLQGLEKANITQFASALRSGTNKAYKAVVKPVEGTVLTVAREGSTYVLDHLESIPNFETLFEMLLDKMRASLANTPNLLPVLKEAGVIDSGGAGLVSIIEGMYKEISGEELVDLEFTGPQNSVPTDEEIPFDENSHLEYGYCTEFIMQLLNEKDGPKNFQLQAFIDFLSNLGDSIVALQDGTIVKVHVHTKTPGLVINEAQKYGEFVTFKMENMSIQHNEVLLKELVTEEKAKDKVALVAVAPSQKIADLLHEEGVKEVLIGGQTMNPSAEAFLEAFKKCNAEQIIVFPNNGNVILTAEQAAKLYEDAQVYVVPCKSAIQCYTCVPMFDFESLSIEANMENAKTQLENTVTAEVSQSIRDTMNNGLEIHKDDFIGISAGVVVSSEKELRSCVKKLFASIEDMDDRSVITVSYGKDLSEEQKASFREFVASTYSMIDLVEIEGEQSVYPFIFAIE